MTFYWRMFSKFLFLAYKPVSTTQDLYSSSEQNQLDPYKVAKTQIENAKLVE